MKALGTLTFLFLTLSSFNASFASGEMAHTPDCKGDIKVLSAEDQAQFDQIAGTTSTSSSDVSGSLPATTEI